jgi:hypothetical protein
MFVRACVRARLCVACAYVCVCFGVCDDEGHTMSERVDTNSGARKGMEARARTHARTARGLARRVLL